MKIFLIFFIISIPNIILSRTSGSLESLILTWEISKKGCESNLDTYEKQLQCAMMDEISLELEDKGFLIKVEKKTFLIIGIGINTLKSPKKREFKSISLIECSNKTINNLEILKNLKKNYELSNWRHWKYKH